MFTLILYISSQGHRTYILEQLTPVEVVTHGLMIFCGSFTTRRDAEQAELLLVGKFRWEAKAFAQSFQGYICIRVQRAGEPQKPVVIDSAMPCMGNETIYILGACANICEAAAIADGDTLPMMASQIAAEA